MPIHIHHTIDYLMSDLIKPRLLQNVAGCSKTTEAKAD